MRLDGYGLFVKNMATMIQFYRDVLGFEIKGDENTDNVYLLKDGTGERSYQSASVCGGTLAKISVQLKRLPR